MSELSQVNQVRFAASVLRALGVDLERLGDGYGIPRLVSLTDDAFRKVIQACSGIKTTRGALTNALVAAYPNARLFEIRPGEIVIELGQISQVGSTSTATYLHNDANDVSVGGFVGDYFCNDPSIDGQTVGEHIIVFWGNTQIRQDVESLINLIKAAGFKLNDAFYYGEDPPTYFSGLAVAAAAGTSSLTVSGASPASNWPSSGVITVGAGNTQESIPYNNGSSPITGGSGTFNLLGPLQYNHVVGEQVNI